jgi:hypothetical protein
VVEVDEEAVEVVEEVVDVVAVEVRLLQFITFAFLAFLDSMMYILLLMSDNKHDLSNNASHLLIYFTFSFICLYISLEIRKKRWWTWRRQRRRRNERRSQSCY